MQRRNTHHLKIGQVLRIGLATYVVFLLVLALSFAPWLAEKQNFGHNHPESTKHHFHSIKAVLGSSLQAVTIKITVIWAVIWLLVLPRLSQHLPLRVESGNFARAPPKITICQP